MKYHNFGLVLINAKHKTSKTCCSSFDWFFKFCLHFHSYFFHKCNWVLVKWDLGGSYRLSHFCYCWKDQEFRCFMLDMKQLVKFWNWIVHKGPEECESCFLSLLTVIFKIVIRVSKITWIIFFIAFIVAVVIIVTMIIVIDFNSLIFAWYPNQNVHFPVLLLFSIDNLYYCWCCMMTVDTKIYPHGCKNHYPYWLIFWKHSDPQLDWKSNLYDDPKC